MLLKKNKQLEVFIILIFISIIWIILLVFSGSVNSGYHFEDDHEMLDLSKQLQHNDFFTVFLNKINKEISTEHRFRFFYYFHRILEVQIFYINFFAISIYVLILTILSTFFLYLFANNSGFSAIESFIFSMFAFIGEQSAIWWRLGPNETIGIFLLSLALYLMIKSIKEISKKKYLYDFLFIILIILFSLTKESFIISIPSFLFLRIYLDSKINNKTFKKSTFDNLFVIIVFILFLFLILSFIIMKIGIVWNGRGLTGFYPLKYINRFIDLSRYNLYGATFLFLILLVLKIIIFDKIKNLIPELYYNIIFFGLLIVPQIIIFSNGIYERYLNPSTIGYAFIILNLLNIINKNLKDKKYKLDLIMIICFSFSILLLIFSILFIYNEYFKTLILNIISRITSKNIHESWFLKLQMLSVKICIYFLIIGIVILINKLSSNIFKMDNIKKIILNISLILIISFNIYDTFLLTKHYANTGIETTCFLNKIIKLTQTNSIITISTEPSENYEAGYSIKSYLNNIGNRYNLYINPISVYNDINSENSYGENWYGINRLTNIKDKSQIDCIVLLLSPPPYSNIEPFFLEKSASWFNPDKYDRYQIGNNILYQEKD